MQILLIYYINYSFLEPHDTNCCSDDGQLLSLGNSPDHCFPIILPKDDPSHRQTNTECMSFVRTITDRDRNCVSGFQPAEQVSLSHDELKKWRK